MTPPPDAEVAIRIERIFDAPRDLVFRAFLDADLMRQWVVPDDLDLDRITVDARVGGLIEVWHSRHGESTGKFEGRFTKIDPPREVVYRWAFVGTEPEKGEYYETLVTVLLEERAAGQTHLTVVHERLAELRRAVPEIYERITAGWENCLGKLDRAVRPLVAGRR